MLAKFEFDSKDVGNAWKDIVKVINNKGRNLKLRKLQG